MNSYDLILNDSSLLVKSVFFMSVTICLISSFVQHVSLKWQKKNQTKNYTPITSDYLRNKSCASQQSDLVVVYCIYLSVVLVRSSCCLLYLSFSCASQIQLLYTVFIFFYFSQTDTCSALGIHQDTSSAGSFQRSLWSYYGDDEYAMARMQVLVALCAKPMQVCVACIIWYYPNMYGSLCYNVKPICA